MSCRETEEQFISGVGQIAALRISHVPPRVRRKNAQHGRPNEETCMSSKAAHVLIAGAVLAAGCCVSPAQEVIHALTGVASKVDSSAHTITLTDSDGTQTVVN